MADRDFRGACDQVAEGAVSLRRVTRHAFTKRMTSANRQSRSLGCSPSRLQVLQSGAENSK
jgi:hypothetical protein